MMKKILTLLIFTLVLTSCTGGDDVVTNPVIDDTITVEEIIVNQVDSEDDEAMKEFENILLELIESEE